MPLYTLQKKFNPGYKADVLPNYPFEIDRDHPLGKDVAYFYIVSNANVVELVHSELTTPDTFPASQEYDETGQYITIDNDPYTVTERTITGAHTVTFKASKDAAAGADDGVIIGDRNGSGDAIRIKSTDTVIFRKNGSQDGFTLGANVDFVWRSLSSGPVGGETLQIGTETSTTTRNTLPFKWNNICHGYNVSSWGLHGQFQAVIIHSRELSFTEILELQENPYQILKPKINNVYFLPTASGTNVSVTPSSQTYTAQTVTVEVGTNVNVTPSSQTYAAQTVSIVTGITVTPSSQAYTAQTVSIVAGSNVTVTPSSQTYTAGQALIYLTEFYPVDVDLFPANTNGNLSFQRFYYVEGEVWTVQPDDTTDWTQQ